MSKLDKSFKEETDDFFRGSDYVSRRVISRILGIIIILTVLFGLGNVGYTYTIGRAQKNADREVFKSSVAYTEEAAEFIAKSYKEYNSAEDDEKRAIMEYVAMRYPNLDPSVIENSKLRAFYQKCID